MGSRGWVEVLGTLAASCEARRAKPAIFNGRPGSAVESMGAVLPLTLACPVTLPLGLAMW